MKLTKEMLIDWIDRQPSNSDLDLINYIIGLQNNRDKAIEYINNNSHYYSTDTGEEGFVIDTETEEDFCNTLENILKGDSDE